MDEDRRRRWVWIPHVLSALRVVFVALTYWAASRQDAPAFAVLVLLGILTDIMDGPIARHLDCATRLGANVDSAADLLFYLSLPVWTYMFRPEDVVNLRYLIGTFSVLYLAANLLSHLKFGALGVHNRLSRASGTVGVIGSFYVIVWGLDPFVTVGVVSMLAVDLAQRYGALLRAHFVRAAGT